MYGVVELHMCVVVDMCDCGVGRCGVVKLGSCGVGVLSSC